jgi:hypothetical protein
MPQLPDIAINGFSGMNNIKTTEGFYAAEGIAEPRILLNADVDISQGIIVRSGTTKVVDLPGAHSLWGGNQCTLVAALGTLYRFRNDAVTPLGVIVDGGILLSYADVDNVVCFSNRYCNGIFDPLANTLRSWGTPPPQGPMLLTGAGSLVPGVYNVCMTYTVNGKLTGTSPVSTIELFSTGGIQVINRPTDATVWCTEVNESTFFKIGNVSKIVAPATVEPCPSFLCTPPPQFSILCYAFGRVFGAIDNMVYYSEPWEFEWFRLPFNKLKFDAEVTIIAQVPTGLFIGNRRRTVFMQGVEPATMKEFHAGAASIPGSLAYCNNVPELGDILGTPEKGYVDVPVWITAEGVVAGNSAGRLFNLTKHKLKFNVPDQGASLYRTHNGAFQYLSSFKRGAATSAANFSDEAICEVYRNGKLIT